MLVGHDIVGIVLPRSDVFESADDSAGDDEACEHAVRAVRPLVGAGKDLIECHQLVIGRTRPEGVSTLPDPVISRFGRIEVADVVFRLEIAKGMKELGSDDRSAACRLRMPRRVELHEPSLPGAVLQT